MSDSEHDRTPDHDMLYVTDENPLGPDGTIHVALPAPDQSVFTPDAARSLIGQTTRIRVGTRTGRAKIVDAQLSDDGTIATTMHLLPPEEPDQ